MSVLLDVLAKSLLMSVNDAVETRVIALNTSTGAVISAVWLERSPGSVGEPFKVESHGLQPGSIPDPNLPWFENAGATTELRFDLFDYCTNFKSSCTSIKMHVLHVSITLSLLLYFQSFMKFSILLDRNYSEKFRQF